MKPRIIGLAGKKGSGKDTIAIALFKYGYKKISFAEPLKLALAHSIGCTYNDFDDQSTKDAVLQVPITLTKQHLYEALLYLDRNYINIELDLITSVSESECSKSFQSYREIMQFFGTDVVRKHVNDNYWTEVLKKRVNEVDTELFVVTDTRFPDERKLIKELKGTTALVMREVETTDSHRSENLLGSPSEYDLLFYNTGTVLQLTSDIDLWFSLKGNK